RRGGVLFRRFVMCVALAVGVSACSASRGAEPQITLPSGIVFPTEVPSFPSFAPQAGSCPDQRPCIVPGDGGMLQAINRLRAQRGLGPVIAGDRVAEARACALHNGEGETCPQYYAHMGAGSQHAGEVLPVWQMLDPRALFDSGETAWS